MFSFLLVGILGLIMGSFATMLSYRYVKDLSIMGRSKCTSCGTKLKVHELIPVLSFILSRGRCRYCNNKIALRYPLQEVVMMLLFLLNHYINGFSGVGIVCYVIIFTLVVMSVTDLMCYAVPDQMILLFLVTGILYGIGRGFPLVHMIVMPALLGFIGFFLKYFCHIFFRKDGLGTADVKLFTLAGLYLNVENVSAFLLMAGLFGIILGLIWRKMGKRTKRFPFIPAIALSFLICVLFPTHTEIVRWLSMAV